MKLLGSTNRKIIKNKNGEIVPHYLEIAEVVLVHGNIVNNNYQQNWSVLYTFIPLLHISPKNVIFLKTFDSEFSYIEVWFTDQNSKPLDVQDRININLGIN